MEKPKRARRRKSETAKADLKPPLAAVPGGQGVRREAESEGHAEKYRAVIEGCHPEDELVGQGWGKVEPCQREAKAFSFTHQIHGDCGRHGTEEWRVTSGGLVESPVAPEEVTL